MADQTAPYDFGSFVGYSVPNTTQIPDEFLDYHMAFLSGAEVKVMLYIFRRTLGFKRYADNISLNQLLTGIVKRDGTRLDYGTGVSKSTLLVAIRALVDKKLILIEQRQSDERGNEPTTYKLNFCSALGIKTVPEPLETPTPLGIKTDLGVSENQTPLGIKTDLGLARKSDQALVLKIEPTINSSTTDSKTKDSNNNNSGAHAAPPVVVVVDLLVEQGMGKGVAQALGAAFPESFIRTKIEYLEFLRAERPSEVQKPAAWLRRAIEQDFGAPDGFVSEAERQEQAAAAERQNKALWQAQQAATAAQRKQARERKQQAEALRAKTRAAYGTTSEQEAQWAQVLVVLKLQNIDVIYELLATTQVLTVQGNDLLIGVLSTAHHQQLTTLHPRNLAVIKRQIRLLFHADLTPRFVLVEPEQPRTNGR